MFNGLARVIYAFLLLFLLLDIYLAEKEVKGGGRRDMKRKRKEEVEVEV